MKSPDETKVCRSCGQAKPRTEFYPRKPNPGQRGDPRTSRCKDCDKRRTRERYRSKPFEERKADYQRRKDYWANQPAHVRKAYNLWYSYKLPVSEYERMIERQGDKCAICGDQMGGKDRHVDHDHTTGRVRGLLCSGCNTGIGCFKESPGRLMGAVRYLRQTSVA